MTLYPEMNAKVVEILRLPPQDNQMYLYAAQLIEEQSRQLAAKDAEIARMKMELEGARLNRPIRLDGEAERSLVLAAELSECKQELKKYRAIDLSPGELEYFVRCEDCIHGGWTDDVQVHCNKWVLRDSDHRCVGYLGFCGAGEKGKMLEMEEAEAALKERENQ